MELYEAIYKRRIVRDFKNERRQRTGFAIYKKGSGAAA